MINIIFIKRKIKNQIRKINSQAIDLFIFQISQKIG